MGKLLRDNRAGPAEPDDTYTKALQSRLAAHAKGTDLPIERALWAGKTRRVEEELQDLPYLHNAQWFTRAENPCTASSFAHHQGRVNHARSPPIEELGEHLFTLVIFDREIRDTRKARVSMDE